MADVRLGSVSVDFQARNARFLNNLKKNRAALGQQRRSFKSLGGQLISTNKVMGRFVAAAGAAASIAGARAFVAPWIGFQETMAAVQAVTQATETQFYALRESALELAASTRFTARETAEATRNLGTAGFATGEILSALAPTLRLAEVGQLSVADASTIAAGAIRGFKLEAEDTQRVADVMAAALASSNTNLAQLGEGYRDAAPAAASLGISLEETTAVLSALADNMLRGARGGAAFRSAMARMANPVGESARELEAFGLSVADVDVSQRGLLPVLRTLEDAVSRGASVWRLFGAEQGVAGSILLSNVDYIARQTAALESAEGAAERMARTMNDTAADAIRNAGSAWEALRIAITADSGLGDSIEATFRAIAAALNAIRENMDKVGAAVRIATRPIAAMHQAFDRVHASFVAVDAFIDRLRDNVDELEAGWAGVAAAIAVDFVGGLVRAFYALPDLLLRPVLALQEAIVTAFREAGRRAWEAFWDGIRSLVRPGDVERLVRRRDRIIEELNSGLLDPDTELLRSGQLDQINSVIDDLTRARVTFTETIGAAAKNAAREVLADTSYLDALNTTIDEYKQVILRRLGLTEVAEAVADAGRAAAESYFENFVMEWGNFQNMVRPEFIAPNIQPIAANVVDAAAVVPPAAITPEQEGALSRMATVAELLARHAGEYAAELEDAYAEATLSTAEYNRQRFVHEGINRLLAEGLELTEAELAAARETLGARFDALAPLEAAIERQERLNELAGELSDGFAEFARGVLIRFETLGDAAEALGRRIYAALVENLIISPILAFINPLLGIPAAQHGGQLGRGLALVGEAGPELVDFNAPGRVYSNDDLRAAFGERSGGGDQFIFAPVVNSADAGAVSAALRALYPEWEARTKASIAADGRRPSQMRYAFTGR